MNKNEGYTITELVVAMLIGSLIIGFCFTAYGFSQRLYSLWNKRNEIEHAANYAFQTIAFDIERAKQVTLYQDSLMLKLVGNKIVLYRFKEGNLFRNDVQINEAKYSVTADLKRQEREFELALIFMMGNKTYSVTGTTAMLRSSKERFSSSY